MTSESESAAIERLYACFSILADSKDAITEHSKVYLEIISAVKGSVKEKILASQFISRFFKHFPDYAHEAIEGLLDLCEDEDAVVRKQAIKHLPSLCKENKNYTQKISDILAQLLQAEDANELSVVQNSLMTLMKLDPKACLGGIFSQILPGDDGIREKCLKFLIGKIRVSGKELITKEAEDYLIAESKKVLQDVTALEFNMLMDLLGTTRLGMSLSGQQELVNLIAEQAEIAQPFIPVAGEEGELLDRLINCIRHGLPYFSSKIPSTKFVVYVVSQVIPQLDKILPNNEEDSTELELLKVLAELTTSCGALDAPETLLDVLYEKLLKYLPLPPPDLEDLNQEPRLEFSYVECLMYTFHRLLKQKPEHLNDPDKLKDFRLRLQYFARGIQGYIKKLREALAGKSQEELKTEENKLKVVALRTTNNINTLIKDLFHCPPSTKAIITLSWKTAQPHAGEKLTAEDKTVSGGTKRYNVITIGDKSSGSAPKRTRELYQPPGGKFSNTLAIPTPRRGGGGGGYRGRGGFRGARNWRRPY